MVIKFNDCDEHYLGVEFHKIHFNSTKNTSATLTFVRNNFASKIRLIRKYLKGPEVQNIINGLWTVLG